MIRLLGWLRSWTTGSSETAPVILTTYGSDASRLTLSGSESFDVIYGSDTSRVTVTGE